MTHDKFENHNVFVSEDRVKVVSNRGRCNNFDKSLVYRVDYCEGEKAMIHPVGSPKNKQEINIHRLESHNWEIQEEGNVWRYYHRGHPVSQVPNAFFKYDFTQEGANYLFGYMIYDDQVKRCTKCKKNYRYTTDMFENKHCSLTCNKKSCNKTTV